MILKKNLQFTFLNFDYSFLFLSSIILPKRNWYGNLWQTTCISPVVDNRKTGLWGLLWILFLIFFSGDIVSAHTNFIRYSPMDSGKFFHFRFCSGFMGILQSRILIKDRASDTENKTQNHRNISLFASSDLFRIIYSLCRFGDSLSSSNQYHRRASGCYTSSLDYFTGRKISA